MSLSDRVIIVTGAGAGLGRATALLLGSMGARLIVNDYGGSSDGEAGTSDRAEAVVREIRDAGGTAVANADAIGSVQTARRLHEMAMDHFGTVDGLVNNAGIMILGSFDGLSDEKLERVVEINYLGTYRMARAVWPTMKAKGYGRIVNLASNTALGIGNLASYASTKAAVMGLTADMAAEGRRSGIMANSILPVSHTRLSAQPTALKSNPEAVAFTKWLKDNFPPEKVAPVAAYLVSPGCVVTGHHLSAGGGRVARIAHFASEGYIDADLTVEAVAGNIEAAINLGQGQFVDSSPDEMMTYATVAELPGGKRVFRLAPAKN